MKKDIYIYLCFNIVLAFIVSTFLYFSFTNSYSSWILNVDNFQGIFTKRIYQYRLLSSKLLLYIYDFLGRFDINYDMFKLRFLREDAEPRLHFAFYILNTSFTMLFVGVVTLITFCKNFIATLSEKILITTISTFVISLTQFVLVPYDTSSYFFIALFLLLLIQYLNKPDNYKLILLVLTLIISTINRESSALSISLAGALLYSKYKVSKQSITPIVILVISFILVYIGLRLQANHFRTNDGNLLMLNLTEPKNILGGFFGILLMAFPYLISNHKEQKNNITIFYLLSLPYIAMCFYTGILYEVRLFVPLFLTAIILSKYSQKHHVQQ